MKRPVLVMGLGAFAFGRERRAVRFATHMPEVAPTFLISKWGDGSVGALLRAHGLPFERTSFGYLGFGRLRWTLVTVSQWPLLWWTVLRAAARTRARVLYVLALDSFFNAWPAVLLLRYLVGVRLVFHLGDVIADTRFHRAVCALVNVVADEIVVNSGAVRRSLARAGIVDGRMRILHNGVELPRYHDAAPLDFRAERGWELDAILIGYVGQFQPNKGVMDVVQAAELVLRKQPRVRFVLIGDEAAGSYYTRTVMSAIRDRGLGDRVVCTGRLDAMERAYAALDVVVVPSRHEDPLANVAIEAMASRLPIVGSRTGGIPEIIVDGVTGFLVERERPDQIAERLIKLVEDADLRKRMGAAGRRRAEEHFDIRRNALVIQDLLAGGRSRPAEGTRDGSRER